MHEYSERMHCVHAFFRTPCLFLLLAFFSSEFYLATSDFTVQLIGDREVHLNLCNAKTWNDPGLSVSDESVKKDITVEWGVNGEVNSDVPGQYLKIYHVCTENQECQSVQRSIIVQDSAAGALQVNRGSMDFLNVNRCFDNDMAVLGSIGCSNEQIQLCSTCETVECSASCISFHVKSISYDNFEDYKEANKEIGPNFARDANEVDRYFYYCGLEDESALNIAAAKANRDQDISPLCKACGEYEILYVANDKQGQLAYEYNKIWTVDNDAIQTRNEQSMNRNWDEEVYQFETSLPVKYGIGMAVSVMTVVLLAAITRNFFQRMSYDDVIDNDEERLPAMI